MNTRECIPVMEGTVAVQAQAVHESIILVIGSHSKAFFCSAGCHQPQTVGSGLNRSEYMNILKMNPDHPEPDLLNKAAEILLQNGVIGYPTETVYGLGANALSDVAVEKVFKLKGREKNKPILIIAAELEQVKNLVSSFPHQAEMLAKAFWPGPLTIVLKAAPPISESLLGGGNRVGIRIPGNRICLELLRQCGVPITSTSANLSGQRNPISAMEVFENFGNKLDLIIDGGIAPSRVPSTVIGFEDDQVTLIREGAISKKAIEQEIGRAIDERTAR